MIDKKKMLKGAIEGIPIVLMGYGAFSIAAFLGLGWLIAISMTVGCAIMIEMDKRRRCAEVRKEICVTVGDAGQQMVVGDAKVEEGLPV